MRIVINAAGIPDQFWQRELRRYFSECLIQMIRAQSGSVFWVFPTQFFAASEWNGIQRETLSIKTGLPFNIPFPTLTSKRMDSIMQEKNINSVLSLGWPDYGPASVPHFIWLPDDEILRVQNKKRKLQKWSAKENTYLLTDSAANKNFIVGNYSWPEEKVLIVPLAPAEAAQPMSWTEKEQVRIKYAGGMEYFIARSSVPENNIMLLLRAFSIFKKRQHTNMKLVIAGSAGEPDFIPYGKLETYKYRDDVHAYTGIAEKDILKLLGSAYAMVQPVPMSSALSILNAMQSEVPVVSGRKPDEISGDTILYAEPLDQESLGDAMIRLYTNEELKNDLVRKGRIWAAQYNIQQAAGLLWASLSSAKGKKQH